MDHLKKRWLLVVIGVLVFATASASMASQPSQPSLAVNSDSVAYLPVVAKAGESLVTSYSVSEAEQQKMLENLTYEQRLAAQPLAMPEFELADVQGSDASAQQTGIAGSATSGAPDPKADAIAQAAFPEEWAIAASTDQAQNAEELQAFEEAAGGDTTYGTRAVYTSFVNNYFPNTWQQFPYRAVGKLYIYSGNTLAGSCSASVIGPNNVIVTAAHCVFSVSAKRWYSGWVFVPAYRNGAAPYGTWSGSRATVMTSYTTTGAISVDVAVIKLNTKLINGAYRPVSYLTGYLGYTWNNSYTLHMFAQGYPSNLMSGQYLWSCAAETFYKATDVIGMGCNMTYGSSGGPWIKTFYPFNSGVVNYVGSVVSGVPAGEPLGQSFFGPRFTSGNIVPICAVQKC